MEKYIHKVNYYETDKMEITHHSNYIRWMEDFLDKDGKPIRLNKQFPQFNSKLKELAQKSV